MPSISQTTLFFVLASSASILAAPAPIPDSNLKNNAYTGKAGNSTGGSVLANAPPVRPSLIDGILGDTTLLDLGSNNGGEGNRAESGSASSGSKNDTLANSSSDPANNNLATESGNKYTGDGGQSTGGNTVQDNALFRIGSGNAGSAGSTSSGNAGQGFLIPIMPAHKLATSTPSHNKISRFIQINLD